MQLPGHAARTRAPRHRPFHRSRVQFRSGDLQAIMRGIAFQHGEEFVLRAVVEAQPQTEAVGQRHLFLHGLGRVDGG